MNRLSFAALSLSLLASVSCRSTSSEIASASGLNDNQNLTYNCAAPGQDDVKLDIRFNSNFTATVKLDDSPGKPGNPPTTTRGKTTYNNFHFVKFSGITDVDTEMADTLFKSTGSGRIHVILGGEDGTLRYNCKPAPTVAKAVSAPLTKGRFRKIDGSAIADASLRDLTKAGTVINKDYTAVYHFTAVAGVETKDANARVKRIKEVMHRYMCSFFDESIDLARDGSSDPVAKTLNTVNLGQNSQASDADNKAFANALGAAFKNTKLDIVSGSAAGNNTSGAIMGVYDVAHDDVMFFGFTNCGSDN